MNEFEAVDRARGGDADAFGELYERYKGFVWNVVFRMTYDHDEAEDLAQEVFVSVWKSLPSFRGGSSFSTWLYRITVNRTLSRLKNKREVHDLPDEKSFGLSDTEIYMRTNPETAVETVEAERTLAKLLAGLDPDRRMAIVLRELAGLSYEEIAESVGAPIGTVRSRISRARAELSELAGKMEESQ